MKTNFVSKLFGPGLDAGTASAAGSGGSPYMAAAQSGIGLIQSILGYVRERKAEKALEKLQSPTYTPNQSIMDYYNQALQRYNVDPASTALYKRQKSNIAGSLAYGVGQLQNRRAGQAGISGLVRAQNDAMLNAEATAENQQNQRFGMLGQAASMKAGEEGKEFDINKMQPFERKYNLLAMKAGGGANMLNAGLQNAYGGLQTGNQYSTINKTYG